MIIERQALRHVCTPDCLPRVQLYDGRMACTYSEAWRHECEARMILNMRTLEGRRGAILAIANLRGKPAADRLQDTIAAIWRARHAPTACQIGASEAIAGGVGLP